MENLPLVSIICTSYNHEAFIKDALEGFLMQKTSFPFEIIISDDASTDKTASIIYKYEELNPQLFKSYYHKENQFSKGIPFFFNELIANAQGKYIALCEGDDYWTDPLKLQKQVDFLEANPEYIITYHDFKTINSINNLLCESQYPVECKRDYSANELKRGAYILTLCLCFRNVIKEFPAEMTKAKNGDTFLIALLGKFGKGKFMEDIEPAVYRQHNGGIWSSASSRLKRRYHRNTFKQMSKYFIRIGDSETGIFYKNLIKERSLQYFNESVYQNKFLNIIESYILYFFDFKVYINLRKFLYPNKMLFKYFYRRIFRRST